MDLNVQHESEQIGEDAILESLFAGCDAEGTGFVKVSKLVEYLSFAVAGDDMEFGGSFEDLAYLFDPEKKDPEIDIDAYRKGMEGWIDAIRRQNYETENINTENYNNNRATTEEWITVSCKANQGDPSMNNSSESVEGIGGESPQKQDWELVTKIEDLQLNNKRLVDHNAELSFQMENTEEINAQLLQEVEELHKQLRSYQNLDEKNKAIEKENEDLRQTVAELHESSKNFQNKAKQLERDRITLNEFQEELQTKLSAAHRRLESLSNDHKSVCLAYSEEKQKLVELEELQGVKEEIDKESTDTRDYLTNVISELSTQKEALQLEKNKMETELSQVREDLNRLMVRSTSMSTPEKRSFYATPGKSITLASSLQQEIQELSCNDCLPSPLIGLPNSFLNETYESDVFESSYKSRTRTSPLSLSSLNSSLSSSLNSRKSNEILTTVAVDFREKKDKALNAISELVQLDKTRETKEVRECLQNELEKEMEFFAEKIWLLSLARKASEKRASKLLALIEILKEENKQLLEERDRALQKIGNLSLGSDDLETRVESLTSELNAALENVETLEKRCTVLQNEVNEANSELQRIKTHSDLAKEYDNALATISKLERELERTSLDLSVEKERSFNLQESLSLSVSKHEQELQDIMETIPSATYNDSYSKSNSKPSAVTGYQVRTKLCELLANKHLTIRDSPDGKPTNHEEDLPVGISTPIDGSHTYLNCQSPSKDAPEISLPPFSDNDERKAFLDNTRDLSCNSDDEQPTSDVSPNLIRPFKIERTSWSSPNLVNPFQENHAKNLTFTKVNNGKELQEWNFGALKNQTRTSASSDDKLCAENIRDLGNESSPEDTENCARNLAGDFSEEATRDVSASLSPGQYSDDSDEAECDKDFLSVPQSPAIPQRFLEYANVTQSQRTSGVADSPPIVRTEGECSDSQENQGEATSGLVNHPKDAGDQNLIFTFDALDIEHRGQQSDGSKVPSRLTSSSGDAEGGLEGYDSDYRSSPSVLNSYIEGVSLNSNLPSDEKELEKLFKNVSLAFRTDKDTLPQRLEYQERARDTAETNVVKNLQCLTSGLKGLENTVSTSSNKQVLKKSLDSLCQQISLLKESSRKVSSQSHQFGCYQQEARMMSGVDVLINYGENVSRRIETLTENLNAKELQEDDLHRLNRSTETKRRIENAENGQSSRRGSAFYNFMSSMRAKDAFGLFGTGEPSTGLDDNTRRNSDEPSSEDDNTIDEPLAMKTNREQQPLDIIPKKDTTQRSCISRCIWFILTVAIVLLLVFLLIVVTSQYSDIDRDFVVEQIHRNLKRFEVKLYGQEPAV